MALRRGVDPGLLARMAGHFHPVLLVQADWPTGVERMHSGLGALVWSGFTWAGVGKLVRFVAPEEGAGLVNAEATVKVSATLQGMLAMRGQAIRNRQVQVWFGAVTTAAGNVLTDPPVSHFSGYFDSRAFSFAADAEDRTHDLTLGLGVGPSARAGATVTHSYEDQIAKFPGDTGGRLLQNAIKRAMNPPTWPQQ